MPSSLVELAARVQPVTVDHHPDRRQEPHGLEEVPVPPSSGNSLADGHLFAADVRQSGLRGADVKPSQDVLAEGVSPSAISEAVSCGIESIEDRLKIRINPSFSGITLI